MTAHSDLRRDNARQLSKETGEFNACGYRKWCKELKNGWICRSCARIEKEKKNAKL